LLPLGFLLFAITCGDKLILWKCR